MEEHLFTQYYGRSRQVVYTEVIGEEMEFYCSFDHTVPGRSMSRLWFLTEHILLCGIDMKFHFLCIRVYNAPGGGTIVYVDGILVAISTLNQCQTVLKCHRIQRPAVECNSASHTICSVKWRKNLPEMSLSCKPLCNYTNSGKDSTTRVIVQDI